MDGRLSSYEVPDLTTYRVLQATLVSNPREILESYKPGSPLMIEMKIDVAPDIQFAGDYKSLTVGIGVACVWNLHSRLTRWGGYNGHCLWDYRSLWTGYLLMRRR